MAGDRHHQHEGDANHPKLSPCYVHLGRITQQLYGCYKAEKELILLINKIEKKNC